MFAPPARISVTGRMIAQIELVYHVAVRHVRRTHGNALIGLLMNMMQTVVMIVAFYVLYHVLGLTSQRIRGDFILYIMSGIFLYVTHIRTIAAVTKADDATSPMMKHAPMTPIIAVAAAAIGTLYIQLLSMLAVLLIYSIFFQPVHIYQPIPALGMVLVAWLAGVAIGLLFRAFRPWAPELVTILTTVFMRANMIASGKMFVANAMPHKLLVWFSWNPLFHTIDQARGFVFINYMPHHSSPTYPLIAAGCCLMIGLIAEYYT
ncbi:ABC transporter permease, partial [Thioclava sp. BHET1]